MSWSSLMSRQSKNPLGVYARDLKGARVTFIDMLDRLGNDSSGELIRMRRLISHMACQALPKHDTQTAQPIDTNTLYKLGKEGHCRRSLKGRRGNNQWES